MKNRINNGADYIKIIKEPWKATLDKVTVAAIVKEAHKQKRKAVVHVSKVKDGYEVLKDKADGLVHVWDDKPYRSFMLAIIKSLEPRREDEKTILFEELDEFSELIFFMNGQYMIGYSINNQ